MAITINGNGTLSGVTAGLTAASMPAGSILQTVSCPKTDHVTMTDTDAAWNDITGVDQAGSGSIWCCKITPRSSSNKIIILWDISICMDGNDNVYVGVRLMRDSTAIHQGPASHASTARATAESMAGQGKGHISSGTYQDSPSSTSELTYKLQAYWHSHGISINAGGTTSNHNYDISSTSNIILLEVAG